MLLFAVNGFSTRLARLRNLGQSTQFVESVGVFEIITRSMHGSQFGAIANRVEPLMKRKMGRCEGTHAVPLRDTAAARPDLCVFARSCASC